MERTSEHEESTNWANDGWQRQINTTEHGSASAQLQTNNEYIVNSKRTRENNIVEIFFKTS